MTDKIKEVTRITSERYEDDRVILKTEDGCLFAVTVPAQPEVVTVEEFYRSLDNRAYYAISAHIHFNYPNGLKIVEEK